MLLFPETMKEKKKSNFFLFGINYDKWLSVRRPDQFYHIHQCYLRDSSPWIVSFHVKHSITSVIQSVMCHATLNKIVGNRHSPECDGLFILSHRVVCVCVCASGHFAGILYRNKSETNEPRLSTDSCKYESKVVWAWCERCGHFLWL